VDPWLQVIASTIKDVFVIGFLPAFVNCRENNRKHAQTDWV